MTFRTAMNLSFSAKHFKIPKDEFQDKTEPPYVFLITLSIQEEKQCSSNLLKVKFCIFSDL